MFGISFAKLGIHPGGGCSYFLTQAIGRQRALTRILDGGSLTAVEALRLGLVLDVVDDPLEASIERAQKWAAVDPQLARDMTRAGPSRKPSTLKHWHKPHRREVRRSWSPFRASADKFSMK